VSDRNQSIEIETYTSVGGAAFMVRLIDEWRAAGLVVNSYEATSEEEYRKPKGVWGRTMMRLCMYPGYAVGCWMAVRKSRFRRHLPVRVVTTNPFFGPVLVESAANGQGDTVNLVYDLFPEALIQSGKLRNGSFLARKCAAITANAFSRCTVSVFLGERLRAYAEEVHGPARRAVVIPVGADGSPFSESEPRIRAKDSTTCILYCGLMGRMHETDTLLGLWKRAETSGVKWCFQASGAGYKRLRDGAPGRGSISWGGPLPSDEWRVAMQNADVALVTVAPGAERVVMPSKTYSAMVAGQAILAICPRGSDLADLVLRHGCGWIVEPGDVEGLERTVRSISEDAEEVYLRRRRAYEAGHKFYDMAPISKCWMSLFEEISRQRTSLAPDACEEAKR